MSESYEWKLRDAWIGVDLDGTLAHYNGWVSVDHIGAPVKRMVERVELWLSEGKNVKIMTARVSPQGEEVEHVLEVIWRWLKENIKGYDKISGITHQKDFKMTELWDDRTVQVIPNTGIRADGLD